MMASVEEMLGPPPSDKSPGKSVEAMLGPRPGRNVSEIVKEPGAATGEIVSTARKGLDARAARFKEAQDAILGRSPDVDYETGLTFMDRVALDKADNDAERAAYLEQRYGKDNVEKDQGGNFYVKKDGKKISAVGGGSLSGMAASATANAPQLVAGGALAAMAPEFALPAMVAGSMLGKGATEAQKAASGTLRKTPGEEAKTLGMEGLMGGAGELGGRALIGTAGRLTKGPAPRMISGTTPESDRMTALTLRGGAVPPIKSALPSSRVSQWHQALGEKVVGPFAEKRNLDFIDNEVKGILRNAGVPESDVGRVFQEITNPASSVSSRDAGAEIISGLKQYRSHIEATSENEMKTASKMLDENMKHLDTLTRRFKTGDLGVDVAGGIKQARKDLSTAAGKIYGRIDNLVGDEPIVPTKIIKREAQRILKALPKSDNRTIFNEIAELPDNINFSDAQRLRTRLGEQAESANLTPGAIKHDFSNLRRAVDVSFNAASANPKAAPAINLLRSADKFYSDGIKKFEDATVNKLVREAKSGTAPDPSVIASTIIKPGYSSRVSEIKGMLPAETWKRVAGADFDNLIRTSTNDATGEVSGKTLLANVNAYGKLLDTVHGPKMAGEIRGFATKLAARDEVVPASILKADTFGQTMRNLEQSRNELNDFLGKNYLSALTGERSMADNAVKWIVKPGQEDRLIQAFNFFGPNSRQVIAIRQQATRDLLSSAIVNTETGVGRTVAGSGLEKALSKFTAQQQEILFPNGLADDMRLLAKEAKFLFPQEGQQDMAAGLAAGFIKAGMPWTMPGYLHANLWGWVLSRPGTVRMLAIGLRGDGPTRAATRETMRNITRAMALGMTPDVGGENESQQ